MRGTLAWKQPKACLLPEPYQLKGHFDLVSQQVARFPMTITERLTFQQLKIKLIFTDNEGKKLLVETVSEEKIQNVPLWKIKFSTATVSETPIPRIYKVFLMIN